MKIRCSAVSPGFTMTEIMIVVAIVGLLVAIAIPSTVRARNNSQTNACINNLREIQAATQIWAIETKQSPTADVNYDNIRDYMKRSVVCPAGSRTATFSTTYRLNGVTNPPSCQIVPDDHVVPIDSTN